MNNSGAINITRNKADSIDEIINTKISVVEEKASEI